MIRQCFKFYLQNTLLLTSCNSCIYCDLYTYHLQGVLQKKFTGCLIKLVWMMTDDKEEGGVRTGQETEVKLRLLLFT